MFTAEEAAWLLGMFVGGIGVTAAVFTMVYCHFRGDP